MRHVTHTLALYISFLFLSAPNFLFGQDCSIPDDTFFTRSCETVGGNDYYWIRLSVSGDHPWAMCTFFAEAYEVAQNGNVGNTLVAQDFNSAQNGDGLNNIYEFAIGPFDSGSDPTISLICGQDTCSMNNFFTTYTCPSSCANCMGDIPIVELDFTTDLNGLFTVGRESNPRRLERGGDLIIQI